MCLCTGTHVPDRCLRHLSWWEISCGMCWHSRRERSPATRLQEVHSALRRQHGAGSLGSLNILKAMRLCICACISAAARRAKIPLFLLLCKSNIGGQSDIYIYVTYICSVTKFVPLIPLYAAGGTKRAWERRKSASPRSSRHFWLLFGITGFRLSNNTPRGGENKITNIIPRQIRILFPRTIEKDRCYSKGYNRRCVIPKPKTCYSKALNHEGGLVGCGPAHCQRHDTEFRHAPALAPMCSQPHQLLW